MDGPPFTLIEDPRLLDALFERSRQAPVVLFLHAPHCGTSRMAYRAMRQLDHAAALVDVARQRALSRAIEERTGVTHESPQVIVLRDGVAVWSASHDAITTDSVSFALRAVA